MFNLSALIIDEFFDDDIRQYQFLDVLGLEGTNSTYQRAKQKKNGDLVVIKTVVYKSSESAKNMASFFQKLSGHFKHENIVGFQRVIREDTKLYFIYDNWDASWQTLSTVMDVYNNNGEWIGEKRIMKWIEQVVRGVDYLHKNQLFNIRLDTNKLFVDQKTNIVKIRFDVEECCYASPCNSNNNNNNANNFKLPVFPEKNLRNLFYCAPEVWENKPDFLSDVWSVGAVIIHLTTQKIWDFEHFSSDTAMEIAHEIENRYSGKLSIFVPLCLQVGLEDRPTIANISNQLLGSDNNAEQYEYEYVYETGENEGDDGEYEEFVTDNFTGTVLDVYHDPLELERCKQLIHVAAMECDLQNVIHCVNMSKELVNLVDGKGNTPLYYACQLNDFPTVVYLLKEGAQDVGLRCCILATSSMPVQELLSDYGLTAKAFMQRQNQFIEDSEYLDVPQETYTLMQKCAELKKKGSVFDVVMRGDYEALKFFSELTDFDVNALDEKHNTALFYACFGNHTELVKLLLHKGAEDVGVKSVFDISISTQIKNILKTVGMRPEHRSKYSYKILQKYVPRVVFDSIFDYTKHGDVLAVLNFLENKRFNINTLDEYGNTVLYYSCLCGHLSLVNLFLERGAKDCGHKRCWDAALTEDIRNALRPHMPQKAKKPKSKTKL